MTIAWFIDDDMRILTFVRKISGDEEGGREMEGRGEKSGKKERGIT